MQYGMYGMHGMLTGLSVNVIGEDSDNVNEVSSEEQFSEPDSDFVMEEDSGSDWAEGGPPLKRTASRKGSRSSPRAPVSDQLVEINF